ncbi:autotransporter outer membrane beta-barrel domain-containing protein [Rhodobacteraceae bacterium B1Z28]|uniref:Autotransporter outer membrane beta-barrel domain-containing protein n=1 Tax=Ruegeria haliotis TaxID=2747601 RepID=A0ABX2PYA8_9RHOB|nr:autotransporter outer membrane beta-barrel domain-containing protein [Ruegeria haliotis]NVO58666.1 autotransporter outer membrane beta-barrel domain-containing protein [Ruegeria haliotis]
MKKVMITSVTVFAIVASAGICMAGPSHGLDQRGYAKDVRSSVSQVRNRIAMESNGSKVLTVSRALTELTTTAGPTFWVEADGERDSYDVGEGEMTTNSGSLRYGANLPLGEFAGGQLFGGLEFGIGSMSSNVGTSFASVDISTDAYDATLSALWVADSLFYIDGQLRYGFFDSQIRPNGVAAVDADGSGYEISVELGKPFTLSNEWTLIPQVQVMYSDIDMDDVPDRVEGGRIGSLVDGDTLTTRVGLRAERAFANNSMLYGQIDFYHTFDTTTLVVFGKNTVVTERGQDTAALSIGGNVALSDRSWLFGEITTETGLGSNSDDYAVSWNIGVEVQF